MNDVPVPLPGSPDPIKSKEPVNSTVCTSEPLTSRTSDPLLASEKALATKSGEFALTSSLRSPSITVSSANTDLLKLFELFEVSYKPFTSTALSIPAESPTFVYPAIDFEDPNDRLQSVPSSLQSMSSRSGIAVIVPVPAPNVIDMLSM